MARRITRKMATAPRVIPAAPGRRSSHPEAKLAQIAKKSAWTVKTIRAQLRSIELRRPAARFDRAMPD